MKKGILIALAAVGGIVVLLIIIGLLAPKDLTVYPVQCNDWFMATPPYTENAPAVQDFSTCHTPEALERQTFKVNTSKSQVTQTSPDSSDVNALADCTVQDNQHWSCGSFSTMPGGILGATEISRSGNNFSEDGLSAVIFVTKDQWGSINNGKDSICGNTWCNSQTTQAATTPVSSTTTTSATDSQTSAASTATPVATATTTDSQSSFPTPKCVTESGVKICDLSHSIQQSFGDGTRMASFPANAIDCVDIATGNQTQSQGNTVQVDGGNTYCASDLGAVYIDPTIQVAKYYGDITTNSDGNYSIPTSYGTCIWTYAGGSGDIPAIEVSNNVGPTDSYYSTEAFCKNDNNEVDIYSYNGN